MWECGNAVGSAPSDSRGSSDLVAGRPVERNVVVAGRLRPAPSGSYYCRHLDFCISRLRLSALTFSGCPYFIAFMRSLRVSTSSSSRSKSRTPHGGDKDLPEAASYMYIP